MVPSQRSRYPTYPRSSRQAGDWLGNGIADGLVGRSAVDEIAAGVRLVPDAREIVRPPCPELAVPGDGERGLDACRDLRHGRHVKDARGRRSRARRRADRVAGDTADAHRSVLPEAPATHGPAVVEGTRMRPTTVQRDVLRQSDLT